MKKIFNKITLLFFIGAILVACDSEDELTEDWIEANTPDPAVVGTLDLTKYISVGNSLTAGFADGALFPKGQENSFPSILAGQFALAGGGEFNNPNIISAENGTGRISLDINAALAFLENGEGSLADALITADASPLSPSTVSVNNFGVPGARAIDIVTMGYGGLNPFYGAFQSSASASVISDAAAADATFFSLWIGSNDVLGYAVDGGSIDTFDPFNPATITDSPINPTAPAAPNFLAAVTGALDGLSANGATGVILTIPPVTTIPYFQAATTLSGGVELVPLTDATQVAQLNGAFNIPIDTILTGGSPGYNVLLDSAASLGAITQAEADRRKVSWVVGANAPLITDESLTELTNLDLSSQFGFPAGSVVVPAIPQLRQASGANPVVGLGDLFPLPALFSLGTALSATEIIGITVPLADSVTLTETEQINVITATATFNGIIRAQAQARANVLLVDLDPLFADVNGLDQIQATGLGMSADGIAAADGVQGRDVNGINLVPISFESTTLFNSVFSTDFIHPNPRGSALIVNEIISVINSELGSEISVVNPLDYPSINAPF